MRICRAMGVSAGRMLLNVEKRMGHRRCLVADTFELQCHLRPHIWVVASTRRDMQYGRLTVVQLVG